MPLIEVRQLKKLYRMGESVVRALDGVDLTVERGDFVAITGPSGSGKSTMMHLLGCLDRPTDGQILFDGRDISDLSDRELAAVRNKKIGFVFQTFNLINRTSAAENVAVPLFYARQTNTRAPAVRALERVGLVERAKHNPNELSGGERQRVAIARAIVNDPLLLLADEPTGNLDSRTGEQIMRIFHELSEQGVTIIIVTHEPYIARQARRVVMMRDGKIVSDQTVTGPRPAESATGLAPESEPQSGWGEPWHPDADEEPVQAELPANLEPTEAPPAEPVQPAAAAAVDYSGMTPRVMRGATVGLVFGLTAAGLWLAVVAIQVALATMFDLKAIQAGPGKMPPTPVIVGGLLAAAGMLAAIVTGILAIVFSMGARRRMRREPGNWRGGWRSLVGMILGWLAVAVPVVGIAVSIIQAVSGVAR